MFNRNLLQLSPALISTNYQRFVFLTQTGKHAGFTTGQINTKVWKLTRVLLSHALTKWIKPHSPQPASRGLGTTRAESCSSSFVMNNRSTCWGLSRLSSLTSFSGLWKCFTIPLIASPTPSWIWPVFNSGWRKKGKQRRCKIIKKDTCRFDLAVIVFFLLVTLNFKY